MLAQLLLVSVGATSIVGEYQPDFSHVAEKSRSPVEGYFQGRLYVGPDGSFDMPSIHQTGFWREDKGKFVFVYTGFFDIPIPKPDQELKAEWPKTQLDGMVLSPEADGSLRLDKFGSIEGPIYFKKLARRTTAELVKTSQKNDEDGIAAFEILWEESPIRWKEILAVVNDAKQPFADRSEAIWFLRPAIGIDGQTATVAALESADMTGLTEKQAQRIRSRFAIKIGEFGNLGLVPRLLTVAKEGGFSDSTLATAIGKAGYKAGIPLLETLISSANPNARKSICDALASLDAVDALPLIRKLTSDAAPSTRVAANGAVLKLDGNAQAKQKAIVNLLNDLPDPDYVGAGVIQALGTSGSKLAIPALISILKTNADFGYRRLAAEQLGDLGFQEALPDLRAALKQSNKSGNPENPNEEQLIKELGVAMKAGKEAAPVRKAVAQAIWDIEHNPKNK